MPQPETTTVPPSSQIWPTWKTEVRASFVTPEIAEVSARVRYGERYRALAVRFEPREVSDLHYGEYPVHAFERVREQSEALDAAYTTWVSPGVRACASPASAAVLKWLHPMRVSRYLFSEKLNPWMRWVAPAAQAAAAQRGGG